MTAGPGDILFFLCLDDRGGAELSMLRLAQGLAAQGRSVTLAVYGRQQGLAREFGFTSPVIDLGVTRSFRALLPLYRILRRQRFQTVISALTHTNIVALAAACMAGQATRVLITEHGIDGAEACQKSRFFRWLTRRVYAQAASVIAVSQGLAARWREILPPQAKIVCIHNPVVADDPVVPLPAHPWLADRNLKTIIGIGRLKAEKDFDVLIRAFAPLAAHYEVRLIVLGEGEQRSALENLIRVEKLDGKVLLPGFVAQPAAWLAHAALFVSASRREGFGNAIVEALSFGVPVVATDCPYGPNEILAQGRYGKLVPVGDVDVLTQAIKERLEQSCNAQELRDRAADYSVARCLALYAGVIDSSSR